MADQSVSEAPARAGAIAQLLPLLEHRAPATRVMLVLVGPVALGAASGVAVGWSAALYLLLQAIAVIGGVLAGFEHSGARSGARRGVAGGLLFGGSLVLAHAISGAEPEVSLGEYPVAIIPIAATLGACFGALGGALRARFLPGR